MPALRPEVKNSHISNQHWVAGFTSAEGWFYVSISHSNTKIGESINLVFQITQHFREEELMQSLIKYFKCGYIEKDKSGNRNWINFRITKFDDITNKIIPFFHQYPVIVVKTLDFADWWLVADLITKKKHLTKAGLDKIKHIKAGMNTGRK